MLFYAGAALSQHVRNELERLAIATTGERVSFLSSLGSTETAPLAVACSWESKHVGNIGLPALGVELKLVPREGKLEARLKDSNITPGYWRAPALTADAFDEEGFYKIGDALKFEDAADPAKGLIFDGRLAEDFKLATGTWVSVGPLRAAFIGHCTPLVRDVVLAGTDRRRGRRAGVSRSRCLPQAGAGPCCGRVGRGFARRPARATGVRPPARGAGGGKLAALRPASAAPYCSPSCHRSMSAR